MNIIFFWWWVLITEKKRKKWLNNFELMILFEWNECWWTIVKFNSQLQKSQFCDCLDHLYKVLSKIRYKKSPFWNGGKVWIFVMKEFSLDPKGIDGFSCGSIPLSLVIW